jgi:hypothetical protein
LLRRDILIQKSIVGMDSLLARIPNDRQNTIITRVNIVVASLFLVGGPSANGIGQMKRRRIVHVSPRHLIASKPDRVTKPLASHPNRHLQAKPSLRMEKGTNVVVVCEILTQLRITFCELVHVLSERDPCSIHNRQVISKRLE